MVDFESGGSRAWEDAGIAEDVRRYGAQVQDDSARRPALIEANGHNTGLEPLPLHELSEDTILAAVSRPFESLSVLCAESDWLV